MADGEQTAIAIAQAESARRLLPSAARRFIRFKARSEPIVVVGAAVVGLIVFPLVSS